MHKYRKIVTISLYGIFLNLCFFFQIIQNIAPLGSIDMTALKEKISLLTPGGGTELIAVRKEEKRKLEEQEEKK